MRPWGAENKAFVLVLQLLLFVLILVLWHLNATRKWIDPFFVSSPKEITTRLWELLASTRHYKDIGVSLYETLLAFVTGALAGAVMAFALYKLPLLDRVLAPYIDVLNALPRVVLAPLFALWFGLGMTSKVVLGMSLVVFIVFFSIYTGLKEVDASLIHKVRLLGGGERDVVVQVLLPSAVSWVFSSLRTSVGFALAGVIVGEYLASDVGIGHLIGYAESTLDSAGVFAGLIILSVVVVVINLGLSRVENYFSSWRLD